MPCVFVPARERGSSALASAAGTSVTWGNAAINGLAGTVSAYAYAPRCPVLLSYRPMRVLHADRAYRAAPCFTSWHLFVPHSTLRYAHIPPYALTYLPTSHVHTKGTRNASHNSLLRQTFLGRVIPVLLFCCSTLLCHVAC
eukprot:2330216-Rhodomonas_salina.1